MPFRFPFPLTTILELQPQSHAPFTDILGAVRDAHILPVSGNIAARDDLQHTERRGRQKGGAWISGAVPPNVKHMKSVDVFAWVHSLHHGFLVDVLWEWQLHQDAVYRGVMVQLLDHPQQTALREAVFFQSGSGVQAALLRRLGFVGDVGLGGGVSSYQDGHQVGRPLEGVGEGWGDGRGIQWSTTF